MMNKEIMPGSGPAELIIGSEPHGPPDTLKNVSSASPMAPTRLWSPPSAPPPGAAGEARCAWGGGVALLELCESCDLADCAESVRV